MITVMIPTQSIQHVKGNPVSMLHYDTSQDTFYELNPQFSSWSGNFGDTPQVPHLNTILHKTKRIRLMKPSLLRQV